MKNLKTLIKGSLLVALIALLPVISFADNDKGSDKNNNKIEKHELKVTGISRALSNSGSEHRSSVATRVLAFLSANHHDQDNDDDESATTAAPVISNIHVRAGIHYAIVSWKTDIRSTSSLWFGSTTPVNTTVEANVSKTGKVLNHWVLLRNLQAGTKYYLAVGSANGDSKSVSTETSFTTKGEPDTVKPVISDISTNVAAQGGVAISWKTNEAANSKVYYGSASPIDVNSSSTASVSADAMVKEHTIIIPGLTAATKYYFIIGSNDASGNGSVSAESTFTTN